MCLAIPGRVTRWLQRDLPFAQATVDFGGVCRKVSMACVPEARVGEYVLVHAGIAIALIDDEAAERTLATYQELEQQAREFEEWQTE